jgi:regulator of sigma E protease
MQTFTAFILAIVILVAVHEWGHFAAARLCGIHVVRFSIGFGPRLFGWTSAKTGTEFVLSCIPLGGYVKFLDEREAPLAAQHVGRAFNQKSVYARAAVAVAGPGANMIFAIVVYALVNWVGYAQPQARLSMPLAGSIAEKAGLKAGDWVLQAGLADGALSDVNSFDDFRWWLGKAALGGKDLVVAYQSQSQSQSQNQSLSGAAPQPTQSTVLKTSTLHVTHADASMFRELGITSPYSVARIAQVTPGGVAQRAGVMPGDLVLAVDGQSIEDAVQLRERIRAFASKSLSAQRWTLERAGKTIELDIYPQMEQVDGQPVGKVGVMVGEPVRMQWVRLGYAESLLKATVKTWDVSILTLRMLAQMVVGQASLKNLSGPFTLADYAGKSASLGVTQFLIFLAMVSIGLGIMNLLPIPNLDGGHLMCYLWEMFTGRGISEQWMARLNRIGLMALLLMMSIAIINDVTHLLPQQ